MFDFEELEEKEGQPLEEPSRWALKAPTSHGDRELRKALSWA